MDFLTMTQPLSLFPLTWLLPSGSLLMQAGNATQLYDIGTQTETPLPNMPHGQRVYPASGGSTALPLTPANGYNLTAIFCGGLNQQATQYDPNSYNVTAFKGITSCTTITPDVSSKYVDTDDLPEGRVMLQLINLPDGRIFGLSGAAMGTAGYGWQDFGNGQGYGRSPLLMPAGYYNHSKPAGQRWNRANIQASTIPRLYHSSATLLPDGAILVAGSNPNADFVGITSDGVHVNSTDPYLTEYRVEKFFPDYYNEARPMPTGMPASITYGGQYFDLTLPASNITSQADLDSIKVALIRTGFSTHSVNFGQRHVELPVTYTWNTDGSATVHVGQLPSNANIMAPGPVLLFLLLNNVPSYGQFVMVGSGNIEQQTLNADSILPGSKVPFLQAQSVSAAAAASSTAAISLASASAAASAAAIAHAASSTISVGAIAGAIGGGVAALLLLTALVLCIRRRRSRSSPPRYMRPRISTPMDEVDLSYPTLPYTGRYTGSRASSQSDLLGKYREKM